METRGFFMTDRSKFVFRCQPVGDIAFLRKPGYNELYQARTTLERELNLVRHSGRAASDILCQALSLIQQIESGNESTKLLPTVANQIKDAIRLLDNGL